MSKATLKKAMKGMTRDELIEMVSELYDARRDAKNYLEYWLDPQPDKAFEEACESVSKLFFFSSGKNRKEPKSTELKKIVKDFGTLTYDHEKTAELLLHIAEQHFGWLLQKRSGFQTAEKGIRRNLESARCHIEEAGLEDIYGRRLAIITEKVEIFLADPPAPERRRRRRWW